MSEPCLIIHLNENLGLVSDFYQQPCFALSELSELGVMHTMIMWVLGDVLQK